MRDQKESRRFGARASVLVLGIAVTGAVVTPASPASASPIWCGQPRPTHATLLTLAHTLHRLGTVVDGGRDR